MHAGKATGATPRAFAWHFDARAEAVPEARHAFQAWLGQSTTNADDIADLAVVLSELASNALAGADGTGSAVSINATIERGELELEVVNRVRADLDHVLRWDLDDPLRGGGRGLMIVRAYTDTLEIQSSGDTVTVRCTRRLEDR